MTSYVISYDFPGGEDEQPLINRIKQYGTWAHATMSTWIIVSEDTASMVRDTLKALIPEGGRLLVVKSANVAAWNNVMCTNEWLQKNI